MSSSYHRLLIYDVKRTTKIDGMGPLILRAQTVKVASVIFFYTVL